MNFRYLINERERERERERDNVIQCFDYHHLISNLLHRGGIWILTLTQ